MVRGKCIEQVTDCKKGGGGISTTLRRRLECRKQVNISSVGVTCLGIYVGTLILYNATQRMRQGL